MTIENFELDSFEDPFISVPISIIEEIVDKFACKNSKIQNEEEKR